ncbi:MAG TPA: DNA-binding protein, partial [Micavibrio sp.]|nr:DNA-binding protein [Micavibrio sp.]
MLNTISQTKQKIGLGTTKIYELIGTGKLKAKKIGRRTFISDEAIQDFVTNLDDYPT